MATDMLGNKIINLNPPWGEWGVDNIHYRQVVCQGMVRAMALRKVLGSKSDVGQ